MFPILKWLSSCGRGLLGIGIFTFFITGACYSQAGTIIKSTDSSFVAKNISDNLSEISFSQIARNKAIDPQLKNIADQILVDHTEILNDLKRIARKMNLSLQDMDNAQDTKESVRTEVHGVKMQELENASGREFEKSWVAQSIVMHEAQLNDLENSAGQLSDAELKAFANKALSKIRVHRDMLRRIKYKYEK